MIKYRILHTEASKGFGGQEIRILRESEGMRNRGHEVVLAVVEGGCLAAKAREAGFTVYEIPLERKHHALKALQKLRGIIKGHRIEIVNTHSSWDSWIGGMAARTSGCKIVRTRHLSTPTRPGLNSRLLFRTFADAVVTTCEESAQAIRHQSHLSTELCVSIPTGIHPEELQVKPEEVQRFRARYGLQHDDLIMGTVCILRFWKGVTDLIQAARLLKAKSKIKWLVVGDGPSRSVFEQQVADLGLQQQVVFTGFLKRPQVATAAMDAFLLLSTAHEGVSQASLQAAYLERPLITTATGGLAEVCKHEVTGFLVPLNDPKAVATAVETLADNPDLRQQMGARARALVLESFTLAHTLDGMEEIYARMWKR